MWRSAVLPVSFRAFLVMVFGCTVESRAIRLSKEQIKWLNNKAHDKRPEIRKLAQEQLDMRFHPERLASDDADEFEDLLLNKDDEDEDEW
jgi:hypothetical protein